MKGIFKIGEIIFVRDDMESNRYIEKYRAEIGPKALLLNIDKTLNPPYYELFEVWNDAGREWHRKIFATSRIEKLKAFAL